MNDQTAVHWITHLILQPHPEGGYYREVYRSEQEVSRKSSFVGRSACTSIYYLLEGADFSGFHRIASDEIWYFHKGAPLHIHIINNDGTHEAVELSDAATGNLSVVVKAGLWFAAEIPSKAGFTLVSCAVAPGFEFSEFEMATKQSLSILYPQHTPLFEKLCRE